MPNHLHCILYFPDEHFDLGKIIGNAKRFMAYEIVRRLKVMNLDNTLTILKNGLTDRKIKKGQKHRVFEDSFDAKPIFSESFFFQKPDYIHYNPVQDKWKLVEDFFEYEHSSASFYETGKAFHFEPTHYNEMG